MFYGLPRSERSEFCVARGQGFEPRYLGPEPRVLPLDDPRMVVKIIYQKYQNVNTKTPQHNVGVL